MTVVNQQPSSVTFEPRMTVIAEDTPVGTVLGEVNSADPEGGSVEYAIYSQYLYYETSGFSADIYYIPTNAFAIVGNQVVTTEHFDAFVAGKYGFEYQVSVRAVDADGLWSAETPPILFYVSDVLDEIRGTAKADTLKGYLGMDKIFGGAGNDRIFGGRGNDILYGGAGADALSGGLGKDVFLFKSTRESSNTTPDRITDWVHGALKDREYVGDTIDLHAIDANTTVSGNQDFKWIATKAFTGHAGELRHQVTNGDAYLYGDVNGDKKADFTIRVDDTLKLYGDDFIL